MMQRTFHLKALINSELHGVSIARRPDPSSTDLSATLNGEGVTLITEAGGEEMVFGVLDLRAAPRPVKAGETLTLVVDDPAESIQDGWASEYRPRTFSPEAEEAEFPPAWEIREIRGGEIMGDDEGTTVVTVVSREMAITGRLELDPKVLPGFPEARPGQVLTRTDDDVAWVEPVLPEPLPEGEGFLEREGGALQVTPMLQQDADGAERVLINERLSGYANAEPGAYLRRGSAGLEWAKLVPQEGPAPQPTVTAQAEPQDAALPDEENLRRLIREVVEEVIEEAALRRAWNGGC